MSLPPDPLADGIAAYARRLRNGAITAEACVQQYLDRIAVLNGSLNAYYHVAADTALEQARRIDRQRAAGEDAGPLMGVPVGVKDIIAVDGMPTTFGSRAPASSHWPEGTFVRTLRSAGCILLGKLATSEMALGSAGVNYHLGTPRNPWDADQLRAPGGSSSGSGVAMAAGLCGFSIGTDTGGSVRTPASFCGVVGMKPSPGIWELEGVMPMSPSLDSIGFMARSADDAVWIYRALAHKSASWRVAGGNVSPVPNLARLHFASAEPLFRNAAPTVAEALQTAQAKLQRAGATITILDTSELASCQALFTTISAFELVSVHGGPTGLARLLTQVNPDVAQRLKNSLEISVEDYENAKAQLDVLYTRMHQDFQRYDAVLAPTKWNTAPIFRLHYDNARDDAMSAHCAGPTRAANVLGLCAISQPVPVGPRELPVGLQIICDRGDDEKLLSIARAVEGVLQPPARPSLSPWLSKAN